MKILVIVFLLHYVCNYAYSEPSSQDTPSSQTWTMTENVSKKKDLAEFKVEKKTKKKFISPLKTKVKKIDPFFSTYTVFPPHKNTPPVSLLFSGEKSLEGKTRVKKVLPALRKKREAEKEDNRRKSKQTKKGKKKPKSGKQKARQGKPKSNKKNKKRSKSRASKLRNNNNKPKRVPKGSEEPARRLIHARDAVIEDYPYVVSIQKSKTHWCSGAILNQRLVITTANCVWKSNRLSRLMVRACSRDWSQGGQVAYIAELIKHPGWSIRSKPDYDVAMLVLDRFLKFSDKCHAVDLPNKVMLPPFDDVWVTSWGAERRNGMFGGSKTTLQVHHAFVMERDKCNLITMRYGIRVTDNFICLTQAGGRAPCTRDTGAPAVSDGVLWGLASWGIRKKCGTKRFPAVYSYLASDSNIDFITNASRFLMSELRQPPYLARTPRPVNFGQNSPY